MSTVHLGGSQVCKAGRLDESGERVRKKCDVVKVMHLQKHRFKPYCRSSKPSGTCDGAGSQRSKRRNVPVCRPVWKRPIRLNGKGGDGGEEGTQGQSLRSQRESEQKEDRKGRAVNPNMLEADSHPFNENIDAGITIYWREGQFIYLFFCLNKVFKCHLWDKGITDWGNKNIWSS